MCVCFRMKVKYFIYHVCMYKPIRAVPSNVIQQSIEIHIIYRLIDLTLCKSYWEFRVLCIGFVFSFSFFPHTHTIRVNIHARKHCSLSIFRLLCCRTFFIKKNLYYNLKKRKGISITFQHTCTHTLFIKNLSN